MIGVVLCGGQSTRMGSDKGLMKYKSFSFAELAISKLAEFIEQVVLSVNAAQYISYFKKFQELTIVEDDMTLDVYGPLKGILSVHLKYPTEDLLVLACDMLAMHTDVLNYLINTNFIKKEDAFVFQTNENIEPLCAIYTAKGLTKIYQLYNQGLLKKNSMQYVLESILTCYLPVNQEWKNYFNNYNSRNDLSSL
ncbi:MAG TPA: molybdenum cofactor guanylyltransferase [Segetibacter sp.]|nr:molybdenum cofactor guanylyltransferase [Segetibacter sp.]